MRRDENRGQAIQIGFVILFGFSIIALAGYQTFIIPDQNRAVEFTHFENSKDEMESVRNDIINSGTTSSKVVSKVKLGTRYPPRQFAVQPPGATGALRSTRIGASGTRLKLENTDADLEDICGLSSAELRSRQLVYQPNYNYLQGVSNVTYENTVTYTNGRGGGRAFQTDQTLIDGTSISLYPVVGPVNESGTDTASVIFTGGARGENESVAGPFELTLPTRLSATTWRNQLLDSEPNVDVTSAPGEAVKLEFPPGESYDIGCAPVGTAGAPDNDPMIPAPTGEGSVSPNFGDNVNPNFGDSVILKEVDGGGADNEVTVTLENTGTRERSITALRFPFYSANSQNANAVDLPESFDYKSISVNRGGRSADIPELTFTAGEQKSFVFEFKCGGDGGGNNYDIRAGDYFIFTASYEDGGSAQYYASLSDSSSNGGSGRCKN